jgi:hypothetical protein
MSTESERSSGAMARNEPGTTWGEDEDARAVMGGGGASEDAVEDAADAALVCDEIAACAGSSYRNQEE